MGKISFPRLKRNRGRNLFCFCFVPMVDKGETRGEMESYRIYGDGYTVLIPQFLFTPVIWVLYVCALVVLALLS